MKIKQMISILLALCMVMTLLPVSALAADTVTITAQVPGDWTTAYCYSWVDDPLEQTASWPGVAMTWSGDAWTVQIPAQCDRVIITASSSGPQTLDLTIQPGVDAKIVLGSMSGSKYTAQVIQNAGSSGDQSEIPELVDGYYALRTADDLYWFAQQVIAGYPSINGKLMEDIVINEALLDESGNLNSGTFRAWTPIGYNSAYTSDTNNNERNESMRILNPMMVSVTNDEISTL